MSTTFIADITRTGEDEDGFHIFDFVLNTLDSSRSCALKSTTLSIRPLRADILPHGGPACMDGLPLLNRRQPLWHRKRVEAHIRDMLDAFQTDKCLSVGAHNQQLVIRVTDCMSGIDIYEVNPVSRVLWELLERLDVWNPSMRPSSVSVFQTVPANDIDQSGGNDACDDGSADCDKRRQSPRLLVMLCRTPEGNADSFITGTQSPAVMCNILADTTAKNDAGIGVVDKNNARNVVFVRPGSFRALEDELKSHPQGYFTTVHLDMQIVQIVKKSEVKVYFQFVRSSKYEPWTPEPELKAVSKVAKLLALHRVPCAIIAPCPSTRLATEFAAAALISAGMETVVALAYPLSTSNLTLSIRHLYDAHMRQNVDLRKAAQAARRSLCAGLAVNREDLETEASRGVNSDGPDSGIRGIESRHNFRGREGRRNEMGQQDDEDGTKKEGEDVESEEANSETQTESSDNHVVDTVPFIDQDFKLLIYVDRTWRMSNSAATHTHGNLDTDLPTRQLGSATYNLEAVHGRQVDVLRLESTLLLGERMPLLLHGPPGVGKTTLLTYLSEWWKASGMIDESAHIHLGANGPFDEDDILRGLLQRFTRNDSTPVESLYEVLTRTKTLIIFDDLESADLRNQHGGFLSLCSKLNKAGAIVIMASRRREKWLSKRAKLYGLAGLHTLMARQMLMSLEESSSAADAETTLSPFTRAIAETEREQYSVDGIVEMVGGNPLAIKLLVDLGIFCQSPIRASLGLLGRSPRNRNISSAIDIGFSNFQAPSHGREERSLTQPRTILQGLRPSRLGEGFLPELIAPFVDSVPCNDLNTLLYIWSTRVRRNLGEAGSDSYISMLLGNSHLSLSGENSGEFAGDGNPVIEALINAARADASNQSKASLDKQKTSPGFASASLATAAIFWEDVEFPQPPANVLSLMNKMCDRLRNELVEAGMLEEPPKTNALPFINKRRVMRLSPLVPLLFKQDKHYINDVFSISTTVREAHALYYCHRGKRWPWGVRGYHRSNVPEWAEAEAEIQSEFNNFASACVAGLCVVDEDILQLRSILRLAAVLERGVWGSNHSFEHRQTVVYQVQSLALARIHMAATKLEKAGPEHQKDQYLLLVAAIFFCSQVGLSVELKSDSQQEEASLRKMIAHYAMWAATKVPQAQPAKSRALDSLRSLVQLLADRGARFRNEICDYVDNEVFDCTIHPFTTDTPPASIEGESASLEMDLLTMFMFSADYTRSSKLTNDAITALQRGDYIDADELLETALAMRLNAEENDPHNRARLVSIRAMAADMQGSSEKTQQLTEESTRLQQMAARAKEDADESGSLPRSGD